MGAVGVGDERRPAKPAAGSGGLLEEGSFYSVFSLSLLLCGFECTNQALNHDALFSSLQFLRDFGPKYSTRPKI